MTEQEKQIFLEWDILLKNFSDYGQIGKTNGIKFEIRTNEQGHNRPHLHVSTSSASMSIAIDNGEILAQSGKISPAQTKKATEWIKNNKELVVSKWNELSNGFKIEVA